jgi:DNA helicase MCM8
LIIGDPGLGKSRILLSTSTILQRSTMVSGNFCTPAGLTISIVHDPSSGEYMTDAGALVLSDGGICCIDEFDKLEDHSIIFEIMESQQVTVAKGGIVCSVTSGSTILAAANPKNGYFDPEKTLSGNIGLDQGLIQRFDLIYTIRDDSTGKDDYNISKKILRENILGREEEKTDGHQMSKYDSVLLRKYIDYAKSTVHPVLNKRARAHLKSYYLEISHYAGVGIRSLESLIRLTEASAKLRLRSIASIEDAEHAIKIYSRGFVKEEKKEEIKKEIKKKSIYHHLNQLVDTKGSNVSKLDLISVIQQAGIDDGEKYLMELNEIGIVLKGKGGLYQIRCAGRGGLS